MPARHGVVVRGAADLSRVAPAEINTGSARWKVRGGDRAPWVLGLFGAALVRSGRTPSVHGFAEQPDIGLALFLLAVATAVAAGIHVLSSRRTGPLAADVATSGWVARCWREHRGGARRATAGGLRRSSTPTVSGRWPRRRCWRSPWRSAERGRGAARGGDGLGDPRHGVPGGEHGVRGTISAVRGEYFARTVGRWP